MFIHIVSSFYFPYMYTRICTLHMCVYMYMSTYGPNDCNLSHYESSVHLSIKNLVVNFRLYEQCQLLNGLFATERYMLLCSTRDDTSLRLIDLQQNSITSTFT